MSRAIYREQGDKLYKIKNGAVIEVNLVSYELGIIGVAYGPSIPYGLMKYGSVLKKKEFDKYYKEAMIKIKSIK